MPSLQVFFNQHIKNCVKSYVNIQGENALWNSQETGIVIII